MVKLTRQNILHLATLANLPLTEPEISLFESNLTSVLDYVAQVQSLSLSEVPQTSQVTGKTNQFRDDQVKPSLTQTQALSQSPQTHQGYFVVNRLINHE